MATTHQHARWTAAHQLFQAPELSHGLSLANALAAQANKCMHNSCVADPA